MGPLTDRQVDLIQASWDPVTKDLKQNGADLFVALFTAYPSYQQKFVELKGLPIDKVASSKKMRSHGSTVLHALSSIVDTLDDWSHATKIIRERAKSHIPRGVGLEHFENLLKEIFPGFLAQKLGGKLTEETRVAWSAATGAILSVMEGELK